MPLGWVAGAAVVGGLASSYIQGNAAESAANTQAGAAENAQQISENEFNTITAQNQPFMNAGYGALSALNYGLGITSQSAPGGANTGYPGASAYPQGVDPSSGYTVGPYGRPLVSIAKGPQASIGQQQGYDPSSGYRVGPNGQISQAIPGGTAPIAGSGPNIAPIYQSPAGGTGLGFGSLTQPFNVSNWQQLSPAYNFQKQQGIQGVLNADSSSQGALSGAAAKDLINYNQSAANTSFDSAFNQYQTQQGNIFSRLSGIAQLGQASANNTGQQGTALAGQAAQSATNIGTAQAGGIVGQANAISGGISSSIPWLASSGWGGGGSGPNVGAIDSQASDTADQIANWDVAPIG